MGHKGRKLKIDKEESKQTNDRDFPAKRTIAKNAAQTSYLVYNSQSFNSSYDIPTVAKPRKICYKEYTKWRKRQMSSWFSICAESLLSKLPLLKESNDADKENLFIQKLRQCCVVFDFVSDPPCSEKLKEVKQITLNELVEYVLMYRNVLSEAIYAEAFNMFAINIFRPLPPPKHRDFGYLDLEEEDFQPEPSWPHLELVYELFKEFLDSPDFSPQIAQKYIGEKFIVKLLGLFESEDPRERKFLSLVIQKVYILFVSQRPIIRKEINDMLCTFIYESEFHCGIAELLELVKCIIRGYIIPLRNENKIFFHKVILPLHKTPSMMTYFQELLYCVILFLKKDPSLIAGIVAYLLRYWPKTNTIKEARFLDELATLLTHTSQQRLTKVLKPLVKQLNKCCFSHNANVSEKAMMIKRCILINMKPANKFF